MFEGDGYFVRATGGEIALAALSGALVLATIGLIRLARRVVDATAVAPLIGLFCWWLFVWLSPQIHYLLDVQLNSDLALRLVIDRPPGAERIGDLLLFRGRQSLADPALGALGWGMMLVSLPRA